jgi:hypothetical protein
VRVESREERKRKRKRKRKSRGRRDLLERAASQ